APVISVLSLHDALPIWIEGLTEKVRCSQIDRLSLCAAIGGCGQNDTGDMPKSLGVVNLLEQVQATDSRHHKVHQDNIEVDILQRSEEHTSELQSRENIV